MRKIAILIAFAMAAFGQRHKLEEVDSEKPEGKLLQQILQESDTGKKAALMEQFAQQFPKIEASAWVLEQLQGVYVKANDPDKTIAAGEKLLAIDNDDPGSALQCLKAAEAKKDPGLIKKWAATTYTNAHKAASVPKPAEADKQENWKTEMDYARQAEAYADYAVYRAAVESRDPKLTIDLAEALQKQDPNSQYAPKLQQVLFVAYRQALDNEKALAIAEKVLATDQSDEDMLLVAADHYLQAKKEPEKVHSYSAKIVEVMASKPKPEGLSDADWSARKTQVTGLAHYMSGKQYSLENRFAQTDQELRKALPLVDASPGLGSLKPEVLFLLGLADYKLAGSSPEKAQESATYFKQCAAIKSPFQATAATNLKRIMTEYRGIK